MMLQYAETTSCRRRFILNYFGEDFDVVNCGACDNCLRATRRGVNEGAATGGFKISDVVHHPKFGLGTVERTERDLVTVLFPAVGYKTLLAYRRAPRTQICLGKRRFVPACRRLGTSITRVNFAPEPPKSGINRRFPVVLGLMPAAWFPPPSWLSRWRCPRRRLPRCRRPPCPRRRRGSPQPRRSHAYAAPDHGRARDGIGADRQPRAGERRLGAGSDCGGRPRSSDRRRYGRSGSVGGHTHRKEARLDDRDDLRFARPHPRRSGEGCLLRGQRGIAHDAVDNGRSGFSRLRAPRGRRRRYPRRAGAPRRADRCRTPTTCRSTATSPRIALRTSPFRC